MTAASELRKTDEFVICTEEGADLVVLEWTEFTEVPCVGGYRRMVAGPRRLMTSNGEQVERLHDGSFAIGARRRPAHRSQPAACR